MMPGEDGFQLAERIRRETNLAHATVILLSSTERQHDPARCRALGVSAYLTKPVTQSELLGAILTAVDPSTQHASLERLGRDRLPEAGLSCESRPLRVLLVEDNATNQELAITLIEQDGHTVETACNGQQALAVLAKQSFDVILMDIQMPEMDGFETTARIREQERGSNRHIPIVAMTAHAMKGDRERCLKAGMDGYVSKPVRRGELYQALSSFAPWDRRAHGYDRDSRSGDDRKTREVPTAAAETHREGFAADVLNRTALLARVGGREDRLRRIVQVFLDESSQIMAELQQAIAGGEADRMRSLAHSLKGAVGLFGAQCVVEPAQALESLGDAHELAGAPEKYRQLEHEMHRLKSAVAGLLPGPGSVVA
jgi:CheY-like chemotaxis protein/HPt (histidine-containing phosphotransfer) domain-containing protein